MWASTGTKDPSYSDVRYLEALIGSGTITTVPPGTLEAFRDHGSAQGNLADAGAAADDATLAAAARLGLDLHAMTEQLQADGIAAFYREIIGCAATVTKGKAGRAAEVEIGQYQRLIFRETKDVAAYDGHHIAVYVSNFSRPYQLLKDRGLITEEPRNHQYRFVDIIDPKTGEKLFEIEHEVRGLKHAMYRRDLVNRQVGQFLEPRRMNGRTVLGSVM